MARPSITNGQWKDVATAAEHKAILHGHRVQRGDFTGPGKYLYVRWSQPCPRGCCYDDCGELIPAAEVATEASYEMRELAEILKTARS